VLKPCASLLFANGRNLKQIEAGQATPQNAVRAVWRSKRAAGGG
jgi:hypothetical protein